MVRFSQFLRQRPALQQRQWDDHPDADALTAFGELRLSARERSQVLAHLTQCPECREVLALSAPPDVMGRVSSNTRAGDPSWWKWRWAIPIAVASLLAGVIVTARFVHKPAPPSPTAVQAQLERPRPVSTIQEPTTPRYTKHLAPPPKAGLRPKAPERSIQSAAKVRIPILDLPERISPPAIVDPETEAKKAVSLDFIDQQNRLSTDIVQPESQPGKLSSASARGQAPFASFLSARPVRLSAPAKKSLWSLGAPGDTDASSAGSLLKSEDGGRTWQKIHVGDGTHLYALASNGPNVWAGGVAGALFHSSDAGLHWIPISVTDGPARLSGTIVGIEANSERSIKLRVVSGAAWVSDDGGRHWRRRP